MAVLTPTYPTALDTATTLGEVEDAASSTIGAGGVDASATTVPITSTTGWPSTGMVWCGTEGISYTGKTGTSLTGCVRGFRGVASTHAAGDPVYADIISSAHHESLRDAIIGIETALGTTNGAMAVRAFTDRGGQVFNVLAYGADPTGAADSTTAFAAAHTAMSGDGGTIYVPPGIYRISSLTFTKPTVLRGAGKLSSYIRATSATSDVITLAANSCVVEHLRFDAPLTPRTAGAFVVMSSTAAGSAVQNCTMTGYFTGVRAEVSTSRIRHCNITDGVVAVGGSGIEVNVTGGDVYIQSVVMDADVGSQPKMGIRVLQCDTLVISDTEVIHHTDCLYVVQGASIYAVNSFFDNAVRGLVIGPTGALSVVRCHFIGCWFSSMTGHGILIDGNSTTGKIDAIHFTDCHVILNGSNGVLVQGSNVTALSWHGGVVAQNTANGLEFNTGVGSFSVMGAKVGATNVLAGNAYGIVLDGSNDNYRIVGNDFTGNTTANAFGAVAATATKRWSANIPSTYDEGTAPNAPLITVAAAASPELRWYESGEAADEKYWRQNPWGNAMRFETVNDALTVGTTWMLANRIGNLVTSLEINPQSLDSDFVVKGDTDAAGFVYDASADSIGEGTATPTSWHDLKAGTTARAPLRIPSGTNLTTPIAGAVEYDGVKRYWTNNTTSGREMDRAEQYYRLSADSSALSATLVDYFPASSSFPYVASGEYEILFDLTFLKTTAGTTTWTILFSAAPTYADFFMLKTPIAGAMTTGAPESMILTGTTATTVVLGPTGSLTTAVNHHAQFKLYFVANTAGNVRIRVTQSGGTLTPRRGSRYFVQRLPAGNVGTFVA